MKRTRLAAFLCLVSASVFGVAMSLAGCSDSEDDGDADTGTDSGSKPDTGTTPQPDGGKVDTGAPDGTVEPTCTPITLTTASGSGATGARISFQLAPNLGSPMDGGAPLDRMHLDLARGLDGGALGTFDLGSAANGDTKTCTECLYLFEDFVPGGAFGIARGYMPDRGTVTIEAWQANSAPPNTVVRSKGSFSNVRLREVTLSRQGLTSWKDRGESTLVAGGKCVTIASASWDYPTADGGTGDGGDAGDAADGNDADAGDADADAAD